MPEQHRAQINLTVGLFVFFATLAAGALMFLLLNQAYEPIMATANSSAATNNSTRLQTGINRAEVLWDNWAFFVLVLSAILGLVTAAFSSRRPG